MHACEQGFAISLGLFESLLQTYSFVQVRIRGTTLTRAF